MCPWLERIRKPQQLFTILGAAVTLAAAINVRTYTFKAATTFDVESRVFRPSARDPRVTARPFSSWCCRGAP